MLPLGCLPYWGGEGVTLIAAAENYQITLKRGFQKSQESLKKILCFQIGDFYKERNAGLTPELNQHFVRKHKKNV